MLATPLFDSALLGSILEAFERRGKALRYHGSLASERELDHGIERLNVDVASVTRLQLRLTVWPDGAFWLTVNKPGPIREGGWDMTQQVKGSLGEWTPREIVARVEESLVRPEAVASIWRGERI
jgi:hypothetical protein